MMEQATVVVGAGVIGLCTALELAKRRTDGTKVYVFDALDHAFATTSARNTGCLHMCYPPAQHQLEPLGRYSFNQWRAASEDAISGPSFNEAVGFAKDVCFSPVDSSNGKGQEGLPDWINLDPSWGVDYYPLGQPNALINPAGLGTWLLQQCKAHGVTVTFKTQITQAKLGEDGHIEEIYFATTGSHAERSMRCSTIVLAAGPWTSQVLSDLFPRNRIDLEPRCNASDWLILKNPYHPARPAVAAVLLEEIVHHKLEFAARNDGTIWACNRRVYGAPLSPIGHIPAPDPNLITELKGYCKQFLSLSKEHKLMILEEGRSFRPATSSELPIISAIPPHLLDSDAGGAALPSQPAVSGVYICTGHGSWGVGLGMGSARLLTQIIHGEIPDIDIEPFTLGRDDKLGSTVHP